MRFLELGAREENLVFEMREFLIPSVCRLLDQSYWNCIGKQSRVSRFGKTLNGDVLGLQNGFNEFYS